MNSPSANHSDLALRLLKKHWGYDSFRPLQADIVASVMAGRDTLGLMPTGGGKSITFQVPALAFDGVTLVVTPLISLMKDQVDNLRAAGVRALYFYNGMSRAEQRLAVDRMVLGKVKLVYVSPEKLKTRSFLDSLRQADISLIVVDEAHCISQWGYDFRPSYLEIAAVRKLFPDAPLLALTATATPEVGDDIMARLEFRGRNVFSMSFARDNLSYIVRYAEVKEQKLLQILQNTSGCSIVYTRSRRRTRELAALLRAAGISADFYHAGLDPDQKSERQTRWTNNEVRVMVATNAFGMGIDKPDVRLVVHYDIPPSIEEYYQEAGRAGRDGEPADAWMAYGLNDVVNQRFFIDASDADEMHKQLCTQKLDAMLGLAEAPDCRRQRLLAYFGEKSEPCGHCDNCLEPPDLLDMTVPAKKFISCIYRIREASGVCFGAQHVIDVLMGNMTDRVARFSLD